MIGPDALNVWAWFQFDAREADVEGLLRSGPPFVPHQISLALFLRFLLTAHDIFISTK
jgi:hypothetical protein